MLWRREWREPSLASWIWWSTCLRTALARTRVVLIRPWRITSVVRERMRALRWSAGSPSFAMRLPWRIEREVVEERGEEESWTGGAKAEAEARKATKRSTTARMERNS